MDEIDQQIVSLLRENARRSFQDIGARVALSAPAVKRRVDRLEEAGVIRGYSAVLDHVALGWTTHAVVSLFCEGRMSAAEILAAVRPPPRGRRRLHRRRRGERDPATSTRATPSTSRRRSSGSATRPASSGRRRRWCSRRCSSGRSSDGVRRLVAGSQLAEALGGDRDLVARLEVALAFERPELEQAAAVERARARARRPAAGACRAPRGRPAPATRSAARRRSSASARFR